MKFILYILLLTCAPALAEQNSDFLAAYDAFRAGDQIKLERYAQRLKNSPLEVYVSYYRLRMGIVKADAATVKAFLSRPEDTPVIDLLRADWLKLLGDRRHWALFDAEFPRLIREDTGLTCYALQSRRRNDDLTALREARKLWFVGKVQPESCAELFDAAMSVGILNNQDIHQRLRLALEAGNVSLAQLLFDHLEGDNALFSAALRSAAADPDRYLGKMIRDNLSPEKITPEKLIPAKLTQELLRAGRADTALFALQRLAKLSTDLTAARWAKIGSYFPEADQQYFYGWLAYEAARNHDGRALQWYKAAADTPLNEQQMAWRVRAALRALDWPEVLTGIEAMSGAQQQEAAWQYWQARALQALGRTMDARGKFAKLSGEYSFYGQLASEELADSPVIGVTAPTYKPDPHAIEAISALPASRRTLALYRMGLRSEALEEWRWAMRNLNDSELLAAAEWARRNEMYDRAIGAADKTANVHDFSLRYLAPYREALQAHIREHGLEEAWVYGLMRQESRFVTSAKSDAGAAGLMQIMPSTARWVAAKLGLKNYRNALIHQLDTNLRLGTYYMKTVLSQSGNSPVMASAAYNAGPSRARQWRGEGPLEGAIYIETIPYQETRDYVKKVLNNTVYYAQQFGDPPRSLKQRLGIVAGTTSAQPQILPAAFGATPPVIANEIFDGLPAVSSAVATGVPVPTDVPVQLTPLLDATTGKP